MNAIGRGSLARAAPAARPAPLARRANGSSGGGAPAAAARRLVATTAAGRIEPSAGAPSSSSSPGDSGGASTSAPSPRVQAGRASRDTSASALAVDIGNATSSTSSWEDLVLSSDAQSYSEQYDRLFAALPLDVKKPVAKPDRSLQAREPGAARVPLSDVFTVPKTNSFFGRTWQKTDVIYGLFMLAMHALCLLAPATYSPTAVAWFFASYFVTGCLGITLSFHRQLSHRSFQTPKWLEYFFAYCGVLAVQGDPIEWASSHRFHHLHCDTPLDPHSPYEGFWWSHAGWLLDHGATMERVGARGNTSDLDAQPFYRWVQKTYALHVAAQFAALWALGGLPALVWAGALRICWVYHVTWFVNSVCHVWGSQTYDAGDLSRNNWWVGILAFGEGWHNNHHAFEFSARHGLERLQFDMTWMVIRALEVVGLATNVKLPSERQKARLLIKRNDGGGAAAPAAAA